ncbi:MAG TPA: hypothetical protein VFT99_15450 [Roseiflexaceae bacterium]|nr:hypothetical protein [Roseiflexaceae bacterium]
MIYSPLDTIHPHPLEAAPDADQSDSVRLDRTGNYPENSRFVAYWTVCDVCRR